MCELIVLRSDNASEFNSAAVQQICREKGIKRRFSNPGEQFQNGKAEKCIGDVWMMTKLLCCSPMFHAFCGMRHGFMLVQ